MRGVDRCAHVLVGGVSERHKRLGVNGFTDELHARYGAPNPMPSVEALAQYVLASIADGSRRPGAWERQVLESLGLVADCAEHHQYRPHGGPPEAS